MARVAEGTRCFTLPSPLMQPLHDNGPGSTEMAESVVPPGPGPKML
jgi:hypothetical protein